MQILAGMLFLLGAFSLYMFYEKGVSTLLSVGGSFLMGIALLLIAHSLPSSKKEGKNTGQGQ